jgi:hypothetical protein
MEIACGRARRTKKPLNQNHHHTFTSTSHHHTLHHHHDHFTSSPHPSPSLFTSPSPSHFTLNKNVFIPNYLSIGRSLPLFLLSSFLVALPGPRLLELLDSRALGSFSAAGTAAAFLLNPLFLLHMSLSSPAAASVQCCTAASR